MSRMAAAAAWGLGKWDAMEQYVSCIPQDSQDGAFFRAVLAVHREQFAIAQQFIDSARDLVRVVLLSNSSKACSSFLLLLQFTREANATRQQRKWAKCE